MPAIEARSYGVDFHSVLLPWGFATHCINLAYRRVVPGGEASRAEVKENQGEFTEWNVK